MSNAALLTLCLTSPMPDWYHTKANFLDGANFTCFQKHPNALQHECMASINAVNHKMKLVLFIPTRIIKLKRFPCSDLQSL